MSLGFEPFPHTRRLRRTFCSGRVSLDCRFVMRASLEFLTGHGSLLLKYACHLRSSTATASSSGAAVSSPCS